MTPEHCATFRQPNMSTSTLATLHTAAICVVSIQRGKGRLQLQNTSSLERVVFLDFPPNGVYLLQDASNGGKTTLRKDFHSRFLDWTNVVYL